MTVKELIEKLSNFDESLEVWVTDYDCGNDYPLGDVEMGLSSYNACDPNDKPYYVVFVK